MKDPFLNNEFATQRLIEEYQKYSKLIIAYDFDNTVFDFHKKGYTFDAITSILRECKYCDFDLIVYTANEDIDFVKKYLLENNIPFDYINENVPYVPFSGKGKIYYNILLDDRAGLDSAYNQLKEVLSWVAENNEQFLVPIQKPKRVVKKVAKR